MVGIIRRKRQIKRRIWPLFAQVSTFVEFPPPG
jgi:hypothetical protein